MATLKYFNTLTQQWEYLATGEKGNKGDKGDKGDPATATTDASQLVTGILDPERVGDDSIVETKLSEPVRTKLNSSLSSPAIPMAMLSEGNNEFVIMASVIASAKGTFTHGQPIVWEILKNNSQHDSSFYRGVKGLVTQELEIRYPTVKNVILSLMTGDEVLQEFCVHFGSTTGIQSSKFRATRQIPQGFQLRGNGTNWTSSGIFNSAYSLSSFSAGLTGLILLSTTSGFNSTIPIISYTGRNNYRIERVYSGLGAASVGFYLVNIDTNARITTAPTADDYVHISNWGQGFLPINLINYVLSEPSTGNGFLNNSNFWTIGMYELWMKSFPISDTKMKIIWQPKTGVTTYKLRRSTAYTVDANGDYVLTTPVEIYTGTAFEFIDTGLTSNTMYYYQLLDQSNVEITQFNSKTK